MKWESQQFLRKNAKEGEEKKLFSVFPLEFEIRKIRRRRRTNFSFFFFFFSAPKPTFFTSPPPPHFLHLFCCRIYIPKSESLPCLPSSPSLSLPLLFHFGKLSLFFFPLYRPVCVAVTAVFWDKQNHKNRLAKFMATVCHTSFLQSLLKRC